MAPFVVSDTALRTPVYMRGHYLFVPDALNLKRTGSRNDGGGFADASKRARSTASLAALSRRA